MGHLSTEFFLGVLSIILIDILLAGDNAVVIAMAVKSLPARQRRVAVAIGAGGAAVLGRVVVDLMITDPWIEAALHPSRALEIGVQIFFTLAVVAVGWVLAARTRLR